MIFSDGLNGSATACYVVWRPRTSGVNQRERLQRTPAPSYSFAGQRSETDERYGPGLPVAATSISGGHHMVCRKIGNPCAEKAGACRSRQNKGAAPLTKAPSAFRRIGGAVRQGTLTITGSNVRLGTEMPVALSLFQ